MDVIIVAGSGASVAIADIIKGYEDIVVIDNYSEGSSNNLDSSFYLSDYVMLEDDLYISIHKSDEWFDIILSLLPNINTPEIVSISKWDRLGAFKQRYEEG